MLQVRCANPTGNFAPKRPFGTFRCSAWLIFRFRTDPPSVRRCSARLIRQAETLELQPRSRPPSKRTALSVGKRSCFRFAARTLRIQGSQTARPYASPVKGRCRTDEGRLTEGLPLSQNLPPERREARRRRASRQECGLRPAKGRGAHSCPPKPLGRKTHTTRTRRIT